MFYSCYQIQKESELKVKFDGLFREEALKEAGRERRLREERLREETQQRSGARGLLLP